MDFDQIYGPTKDYFGSAPSHLLEKYNAHIKKPGRVLDLFTDFQSIHHREGVAREHRHGVGTLARHVWAEGIFRRIE